MQLRVDVRKKQDALGDLFGIFFEDLNHAADGGLYAEMVQNRSFEFDSIDNPAYDHLTAWEKIEQGGTVKLVVETGNPVSCKNPHYLGMDIIFPGEDVGVMNLGYNSGFAFEEGHGYYFTCYAKREQNLEEPLKVSLRGRDGTVYAKQEFTVTDSWQKYELEIASPVTDKSGRLAVTAQGRGKVYLDFVSLFPKDTYKGRRNGMRRDIAEKLEALEPRFMRFPGGCLVHDGSLDGDARDSQYRWKNSIGPLEERPARRSNWGYNQTLGLGFYEYFQFCEDIHAKPLPVLPAGYDPHHHRAAPLDRLKPWIDDALDLIEFANGGPETEWGAKRAAMGHPQPFGLEYIGIGNEEVGEDFFVRYEVIAKAVKERYPKIKVVGTSGPFAEGGEFDRGWDWARRTDTDLVDEHYYQPPEWFLANHHRYDSYDRKGPKVFLGEYASWGNTWYNALTEASFMLGLERNAGAVGMACYAPMLCNVDYINWQPDMIWFDNHRVYATPNYYVQKLFMQHQGDCLVQVEAWDAPENEVWTEEADRLKGRIYLTGYESTAEYSDICVINEDTGEEVHYEDCVVKPGERRELDAPESVNYTLKLKARELEGFKGFEIFFAHQDEENNCSWVLGGWQNQDTLVTHKINGRRADLSQYLLEVEKDREYSLELRVRGRRVETSVDGNVIHNTQCKPVVVEPLYYSASVEEGSGDIILKAVNMRPESRTVQICLEGAAGMEDCRIYQMCGWEKSAENDFAHPQRVSPAEYSVKTEGNEMRFEFPGESFTVMRFQAEPGYKL